MSKYQFNASDIYLPGTDIPRNRLGITEPDLLHQVEETLLQQAYQIFIAECEPDTRFDEAYFKSLHQRTFESLYEWTGAYRSMDMSKGNSMFCRASYLAQESQRIFLHLDQESFLHQAKDSSQEKFAERLARLDALFFHLYGIDRDDVTHILDTFPIVREQDTKAHGRYLTKELILAYMNAVAAGDFTTVVQVGA